MRKTTRNRCVGKDDAFRLNCHCLCSIGAVCTVMIVVEL